LKFFFDAVESDSELRQYLDDFTTAHRQLLMKFIDEGKQSAVFSPNISNIAIEMYIDFFQTYFLQNMSKREMHDRLELNPKLAEEMNMLFMDGLTQGNGKKDLS